MKDAQVAEAQATTQGISHRSGNAQDVKDQVGYPNIFDLPQSHSRSQIHSKNGQTSI
jgi:hypothetical protein